MERKRRLPARAAARVEQLSKKRHLTPPEKEPTPPPAPVEEPLPPLPTSVEGGKPLPTVEEVQPESLPAKEFQSVKESGVMAESLHRSRHKWITETLFERYWTKPIKRKGTVSEDPKNPPKDSMTKVGQVTITIEPHVFDATMFVVKDLPKPAQLPAPASAARPVLQYGPPTGTMPPPPTPQATTSTAGSSSALSGSASQVPAAIQPAQASPKPEPSSSQAATAAERPDSLRQTTNTATTTSDKRDAAPSVAPPTVQSTETSLRDPRPPPLPPNTPHAPATSPAVVTPAARPQTASIPPSGPASDPRTPTAPKPSASASATKPRDPIIIALADKAAEDEKLRDLMKKVAEAKASLDELAHFQKIIDQITAEYKRGGGQQAVSADRLLVDGKTVQYFADEVKVILGVVLASNPHQKSNDLRPPNGSDPLIVLIVKAALDDANIKSIIHRIADKQPRFSDTTDLKNLLDRLHKKVLLNKMQTESKAVQSPISIQVPPAIPNGTPNGHPQATASVQSPAGQQALRSKGPPPSKPDISAVVFEFAGGSGDRYLFPKFSILESVPGSHQVIASFLIVQKGSLAEHGGDPSLDYYQPVTIRIFAPTGRHLDNLAKVVAPQDEVRRYMDNIMDNMTRAEYVLLAMRLPRPDKDSDKEEASEEPNTNGSTPAACEPPPQSRSSNPGVLWATKSKQGTPQPGEAQQKPKIALPPEEREQASYLKLVTSAASKETDSS